MSKMLSLKLQEDVFEETDALCKERDIPRNRYINDALRWFNKVNRRSDLRAALQKASKAGAAESLEMLRVMEQLEDEIPE